MLRKVSPRIGDFVKRPITVRKKEIDNAVGVLSDLTSQQVGAVTEAFLHEVMKHLLEGRVVWLPGFGTFHVTIRKGKQPKTVTLTKGSFKKGERGGTTTVVVPRKYYVSFKRAAAFRDKFWERYGKLNASENK